MQAPRVVSLFCLFVLFSCVLAQHPLENLFVGTQVIFFSNFSGKYVTVDPTTSELTVTGSDAASAAVFQVSTDSGDSFSLIYLGTGFFVSADGGGSAPLIANRGSASTWEAFFFSPRGATGYFIITAQVNQLLVTVQADSTLIPTSVPLSPSAPPTPSTQFLALSPPTVTPTPIPFPVSVGQRIILFSNSTGRWVTVDRLTQQLSATATSAANAAIFTVSTDGGDSISLVYSLNRQFVSADNAGASALVANRAGASTWEAFFFNARVGTGFYTLTAQVNQKLVTVQSDSSLIATSNDLGPSVPPASNTLFLVTTPALQ